MTLSEKLAKLTPEQKEKFAGIKTPEELDALLAENKIELTPEERKDLTTGATALSDDELAEVAGGGDPEYVSSAEVAHDFARIKNLVQRFENNLKNEMDAELVRSNMRSLESAYTITQQSSWIHPSRLSRYYRCADDVLRFLQNGIARYGLSIEDYIADRKEMPFGLM